MSRQGGRRRTPGTRGQSTTNMHSVQKGSYANGTMVYRDRELWAVSSVGLNNLIFAPGNSGLARLDQFGLMFELWRLKRATLRYATAVGTTTAGAIYIGIDFDPDDLPSTLAGVQALTPLARIPVWEEGSVGILTSRVNKARWMYTSQLANHPGLQLGFAACIWNTGVSSVGEFWLDYEIEFAGPAVSQTLVRARSELAMQPLSWLTNPSTSTTFANIAVPSLGGVTTSGVSDAAGYANTIISALPTIPIGAAGWFGVGTALVRSLIPLTQGTLYDLSLVLTTVWETSNVAYAARMNGDDHSNPTQIPYLSVYGADTTNVPLNIISFNTEDANSTAAGINTTNHSCTLRFTPLADVAGSTYDVRVPVYTTFSDTTENIGTLAFLSWMIASVGASPRSTIS